MICLGCNVLYNPDFLHTCSVYKGFKMKDTPQYIIPEGVPLGAMKDDSFNADGVDFIPLKKFTEEEKKGTKLDSGKPPISLIPREALEEEAKALAFGANKYGRYNFRDGIEYSRLIDAAMRHILAFSDGEDIDEESLCNHIGNARANLGMLLYMVKNKPEMDDRYKK